MKTHLAADFGKAIQSAYADALRQWSREHGSQKTLTDLLALDLEKVLLNIQVAAGQPMQVAVEVQARGHGRDELYFYRIQRTAKQHRLNRVGPKPEL